MILSPRKHLPLLLFLSVVILETLTISDHFNTLRDWDDLKLGLRPIYWVYLYMLDVALWGPNPQLKRFTLLTHPHTNFVLSGLESVKSYAQLLSPVSSSGLWNLQLQIPNLSIRIFSFSGSWFLNSFSPWLPSHRYFVLCLDSLVLIRRVGMNHLLCHSWKLYSQCSLSSSFLLFASYEKFSSWFVFLSCVVCNLLPLLYFFEKLLLFYGWKQSSLV